MTDKKDDECFTEEEIAQRRDAALKRVLFTNNHGVPYQTPQQIKELLVAGKQKPPSNKKK